MKTQTLLALALLVAVITLCILALVGNLGGYSLRMEDGTKKVEIQPVGIAEKE